MIDFTEAIGLDVGEKRIGVARVGSVAKLPEPVQTLSYSAEQSAADVSAVMKEHEADIVVVGLPRNLSGEDTHQTLFCREFAATLDASGMRVVLQDEALTSKRADELIRDGVYKNNTHGEPVTTDEVAACLILHDFIGEPL